MAKTNLKKAQEVAAQFEGADVREDYSGRGMYGQTCIGIVCEESDLEEVVAAARKKGFKGYSTDNMGKSIIVYWKHIQ